VTHAPPHRFLHVANGGCTTRVIEAAGIPGARSVWADVLYEGPVAAGLSDVDLVAVRRRFLSPPESSDVDPANDLRERRRVIAEHDSYDELVLWFEHDLFDQLNLIQLLTWIRERLPPRKAVSLVSIGSFPGRPHFKGMGELTPEELAPLVDLRQRVTDAQYALAERAWTAFRSPTPEDLDALRLAADGALPYLAPALTRFQQEYPWTRDGLSRTERRLMELAAAGPIDLVAAFPHMQHGEEAYSVTDGSIVGLSETLSSASPPLLTYSGGGPGSSLAGWVTLTEPGRDELKGSRDRIALCGIERWLGGVRLQGHGEMWRWDDQRQRVVRA
jgi:hypothetical protein